MVTWKVRNLTQFSFALFMTTGISATVVYAQQPPQSDIRPEDTRQAWERTDYGSGPDRRLDLSASKNQEAKFLIISGKPINEEIARGGPFVMNTKAEILQAVQDYHNDTFVK